MFKGAKVQVRAVLRSKGIWLGEARYHSLALFLGGAALVSAGVAASPTILLLAVVGGVLAGAGLFGMVVSLGAEAPPSEWSSWSREVSRFVSYLRRLTPLATEAWNAYRADVDVDYESWDACADDADWPTLEMGQAYNAAGRSLDDFLRQIYCPHDPEVAQRDRSNLLNPGKWDVFQEARNEMKHIAREWDNRLRAGRPYREDFQRFLQDDVAAQHGMHIRFLMYCEEPLWDFMPPRKRRKAGEGLYRLAAVLKTRIKP